MSTMRNLARFLLIVASLVGLVSFSFSIYVAFHAELRTLVWDEWTGAENCLVLDNGRLYCD